MIHHICMTFIVYFHHYSHILYSLHGPGHVAAESYLLQIEKNTVAATTGSSFLYTVLL